MPLCNMRGSVWSRIFSVMNINRGHVAAAAHLLEPDCASAAWPAAASSSSASTPMLNCSGMCVGVRGSSRQEEGRQQQADSQRDVHRLEGAHVGVSPCRYESAAKSAALPANISCRREGRRKATRKSAVS